MRFLRRMPKSGGNGFSGVSYFGHWNRSRWKYFLWILRRKISSFKIRPFVVYPQQNIQTPHLKALREICHYKSILEVHIKVVFKSTLGFWKPPRKVLFVVVLVSTSKRASRGRFVLDSKSSFRGRFVTPQKVFFLKYFGCLFIASMFILYN